MTLEEMRIELMAEHESIRSIVDDIRNARGDLRTLATRLRDALVSHNAREEELLGQMLPDIDAWGEIRSAHMTDDHQAEHRRLEEFVDTLGASDELDSEALNAFATTLLAHLDDEEKTFLNAKVLRDDVITIGQTGG